MNQTINIKQSIREESFKRRDMLTPEERTAFSISIKEQLFNLESFANSRRILLFAAFRSEVQTEDMITSALKLGKEVALPRVDRENNCLTKHLINDISELKIGYMGIPEPVGDECIKVETMDLVVIPGVAFAPDGSRVGYGGGFYDKILPRVKGTRPIIALAYEAQMFEELPTEAHDIMADFIITEKRIINCNG